MQGLKWPEPRSLSGAGGGAGFPPSGPCFDLLRVLTGVWSDSLQVGLTGFSYDPKRRTAKLVLYLPGGKGKTRRKRTLRDVSRREAVERWAAFRAEAEIPAPLRPAPSPTLRVFVEIAWPTIAARLRPRTAKTYWSTITIQLLHRLGDRMLDRISSADVEDLLAAVQRSGRSPATANNAVRVLKTLLREAVERGVIPVSPLRRRVPLAHVPPLALELTDDEHQRFLAAFDGAPLLLAWVRSLFVVALETGLRRGDLLRLTWADVDLDSGFIRVAVEKTRREAVIPISRACREALMELQARPIVSEHVFLDEEGQPLGVGRVRVAFTATKARAGIARRFRFHDLRHSFASRLASRGVPLAVIARALGHASVRTCERYARVSVSALDLVRVALDSGTSGV